ncbi:hypothetical protein BHU72_11615 [Desulfuribacillus stibiiarsenatis]|uniref:ABC transporter domain-containing protein n=1 Tax=Desulfuribacillus stibiiarsenatis TaxID=1390249 RepID=A0A1E5L862_9FIRM|nr:ATP-binding cassette domain-containing protein [Desulfuribacillus stibiiarsenatis]OEH86179.1 hypothetical protein BHU72_11615 [Desulfuribacillus stibiiarsenatis]
MNNQSQLSLESKDRTLNIVLSKKTYNHVSVIEETSVSLPFGYTHCFFGPSGCGKTTFLLEIVQYLKNPKNNRIELKTPTISCIFQEDRLLPWLTLLENILFVTDKSNSKPACVPVDFILDIVGLLEFKHYYPNQLSGGMKRRVAIARALAYDGEIFIMDEPFKGLDQGIKTQIINYMKETFTSQGKTVLFVTHDDLEVKDFADYQYICEGPPFRIIETKKI